MLFRSMAPTPTTHAHHQAATLLAAEAVAALPSEARPLLLAPTSRRLEDAPRPPAGLEGQPLVDTAAGPFSFDRRTRFGHRDRLDYSIPILWAMAEHRSQGTLQMMVGRADVEDYWLLAACLPRTTDEGGLESKAARATAQAALAADWVALLSQPTFVVPEYEASAGTNAAADGVRPESTQDVRSK